MTRTALLTGIVFLTVNIGSSTAQNVFGTWRGMWEVSEKFIGNNMPVGQPPFEPVDMELTLHSFDAASQRYGTVGFVSNTPGEYIVGGNVIGLSQNANDFALTIFYPSEGEPNGYGDIVATLTGNVLAGSFNERSPAAPGWTHFRGTISLTKVIPEPTSMALGALAVGILCCRRRLLTK